MLLVDKPADMSSASVVSRLKSLPGIKKAGHAGTLDPFATGLLICLVGRATRLADFFLRGEKTYSAELYLGMETDTMDVTGTVTATHDMNACNVTPAGIESLIKSFQGEQYQQPPAFSAVKHKGRPLYDYARRGMTVEKPRRRVFISAIRVDAVSLPSVHFTVTCSGGTYIRALASDIGKAAGCGAYLKTLRRTAACGFSVTSAVPLASFFEAPAAKGKTEERLIGMNAALRHLPERAVDAPLAARIRHGARLSTDELPPPPGTETNGVFRIIHQDRLLAVLEKTGFEYRYRCVFPD